MTEERLCDLAVLAIEKEIAHKIDLEDAIDDFANSDKNRQIVLS